VRLIDEGEFAHVGGSRLYGRPCTMSDDPRDPDLTFEEAERARHARRPPPVEIVHPNRDKATVQATRLVVALLLLASIGLMLAITVGGWNALEGVKPLQVALILLYILLLVFCLRWNRGILPLAAAFGILVLIFAAIGANGWFERDKSGFATPGLSENMLGLLTVLLIPVQLLLIAFAGRGLTEGWNVEEERRIGGPRDEEQDWSGAPRGATA
jgi:hypothetical protein